MKRLICCLLFCLIACTTAQEADDEAMRFTEESFAAALAAEGLTEITLNPTYTQVNNGPHVQDPNVIYHSSDARVVFAKDKDGKIYHIVQAPQTVSYETVSTFGCGRMGQGMRVYDAVSTYSGVSGEKTIGYPAKYVYLKPYEFLWPCPAVP